MPLSGQLRAPSLETDWYHAYTTDKQTTDTRDRQKTQRKKQRVQILTLGLNSAERKNLLILECGTDTASCLSFKYTLIENVLDS